MANLAEFTVNDKVVQEPQGKFKSNNNTVRLLGPVQTPNFSSAERNTSN